MVCEHDLDIAIAKYLNSGGTIDGLQCRVDVAAKLKELTVEDLAAFGAIYRREYGNRRN